MQQYLDLLRRIQKEGKPRSDVQGVGNIAICGHMMEFDLNDGFPLITTKKMSFKSAVIELLWYLRGDTDVKYLKENGVTIWDEWVTPEICKQMNLPVGELGPMYGYQWRRYDGDFDQIAEIVKGLRENPEGRRHKVIAWNPKDVKKVYVAPCHGDFHIVVIDGVLNMTMTQRSADTFLGVPYNIACYGLLVMMLAQVTGLKPGKFVHFLSDVHIYKNHFEQVKLQLTRTPKPLPRVTLDPSVKEIDDFRWEHFKLENYVHDPKIPADVAI